MRSVSLSRKRIRRDQKSERCDSKATQENKDKFGGKVPSNLKSPLRDGDVDREDDEAYADSYFINANSKIKPGIVDADLNPIMEQSEFLFRLLWARYFDLYGFNVNGNRGIAAGLQNIMKTDEGELLGGPQ
ncbi:DUF2815 family protein [Anaerobacillus sp. HL2]|nr:DUF2815 family protein [Anaerobacillus sp. HL2]